MIDVKYHFKQIWVYILGVDAIAVGRHIFFKRPESLVSDRLIRHELVHVDQCAEYLIWGQWWLAIPRFWAVYVWQWIWVGFNYGKMPFEIEAKAAERQK